MERGCPEGGVTVYHGDPSDSTTFRERELAKNAIEIDFLDVFWVQISKKITENRLFL